MNKDTPKLEQHDLDRLGVRFYTHKKMAAILGVTEKTLTQWSKMKKAPPYIYDNKTQQRIYPVEQAREWFKERIRSEIKEKEHKN